jgi:hypothetical protein
LLSVAVLGIACLNQGLAVGGQPVRQASSLGSDVSGQPLNPAAGSIDPGIAFPKTAGSVPRGVLPETLANTAANTNLNVMSNVDGPRVSTASFSNNDEYRESVASGRAAADVRFLDDDGMTYTGTPRGNVPSRTGARIRSANSIDPDEIVNYEMSAEPSAPRVRFSVAQLVKKNPSIEIRYEHLISQSKRPPDDGFESDVDSTDADRGSDISDMSEYDSDSSDASMVAHSDRFAVEMSTDLGAEVSNEALQAVDALQAAGRQVVVERPSVISGDLDAEAGDVETNAADLIRGRAMAAADVAGAQATTNADNAVDSGESSGGGGDVDPANDILDDFH